jgi:hypothetical protein
MLHSEPPYEPINSRNSFKEHQIIGYITLPRSKDGVLVFNPEIHGHTVTYTYVIIRKRSGSWRSAVPAFPLLASSPAVLFAGSTFHTTQL